MIEQSAAQAPHEMEQPIHPDDAMLYIYDLCREMALMARQANLEALALLLEQARAAAADALVEAHRRP